MLSKSLNAEMSLSSSNYGHIQLILGPMFSGKTTELMRRIKRYQFAKHSCLVIKYANDTRYDCAKVSTHDHLTLSAVSATELAQLKHKISMYSVIGIDEGQFFTDVVSFCEEAANAGKIVIVAALDGSYQRIGFHNFLDLIPLAESIIKLTAVCMKCFADASYTKRRGNETELEVIGGADKYMAVCRRCYFEDEIQSKQLIGQFGDDENDENDVNKANKSQ